MKNKHTKKSHHSDLAEANREIDRLNELLSRVKAAKTNYELHIEKRTNGNERRVDDRRTYNIKSDAQTDLIYEYYQVTGKRLDHAPDFIRYVSDDGLTVCNFEIIKLKNV